MKFLILTILTLFFCSCESIKIEKNNKERQEYSDLFISYKNIDNFGIKSQINNPYILNNKKLSPDFSETGIEIKF